MVDAMRCTSPATDNQAENKIACLHSTYHGYPGGCQLVRFSCGRATGEMKDLTIVMPRLHFPESTRLLTRADVGNFTMAV